MATNYKILGQGVNSLKIDAPENGSTIISELKIKNPSYPTNVDVMCSDIFYESSMVNTNFISSFSTAIDFSVYLRPPAIAISPEGEIYLSGLGSTNYTSGVWKVVYRLKPNGLIDDTFNFAHTTSDLDIYTIALQPDGKILIGGDFDEIDGVTRNNLARFNNDGSLDTSFSPNPDNRVYDIHVLPNGKILVAGQFNSIDGSYSNGFNMINYDGTINNPFSGNLGDTKSEIDLAYRQIVQPDGKILLLTYNNIIRINADGSKDTSFEFTYLENANDNRFYAGYQDIALTADNKILICGNFGDSQSSSDPDNVQLVRLNNDGSYDESFAPVTTTAPNINNRAIVKMILQSDGKILISGRFTKVNSVRRNFFARLNSDGSVDENFDFSVEPDGIYTAVTVSFAEKSNKEIVVFATNAKSFGDYESFGPISIVSHTESENKDYIIKNKSLSYDEEVKVSGGIVLESGQSLAIDTRKYYSDTVIIQAYGIEETA